MSQNVQTPPLLPTPPHLTLLPPPQTPIIYPTNRSPSPPTPPPRSPSLQSLTVFSPVSSVCHSAFGWPIPDSTRASSIYTLEHRPLPELPDEDTELESPPPPLPPKELKNFSEWDKLIENLKLAVNPLDSSIAATGDETPRWEVPVEPIPHVDLRTLYLPEQVLSSFLEVALPETEESIEMCALLCGEPFGDAYIVTTMVVPCQSATENTCHTEREEDLVRVVHHEGLIVLGWIHTHPTQECFLSSVDVHTQVGYQLSLPEAVAIVCSPSQVPWYGVFQLSPLGVNEVAGCNDKTGSFHPHPVADSDLYLNITENGHVRFCKSGLQVVDMRNLDMGSLVKAMNLFEPQLPLEGRDEESYTQWW